MVIKLTRSRVLSQARAQWFAKTLFDVPDQAFWHKFLCNCGICSSFYAPVEDGAFPDTDWVTGERIEYA